MVKLNVCALNKLAIAILLFIILLEIIRIYNSEIIYVFYSESCFHCKNIQQKIAKINFNLFVKRKKYICIIKNINDYELAEKYNVEYTPYFVNKNQNKKCPEFIIKML